MSVSSRLGALMAAGALPVPPSSSAAGNRDHQSPQENGIVRSLQKQQQQARRPREEDVELRTKYNSLKEQYSVLDKSMREATQIIKKHKFELAKSVQQVALKTAEVEELQKRIEDLQDGMTAFAAQAKKDRDEAVSAARKEIRESTH